MQCAPRGRVKRGGRVLMPTFSSCLSDWLDPAKAGFDFKVNDKTLGETDAHSSIKRHTWIKYRYVCGYPAAP